MNLGSRLRNIVAHALVKRLPGFVVTRQHYDRVSALLAKQSENRRKAESALNVCRGRVSQQGGVIAELEQRIRELEKLTGTDALTQVKNVIGAKTEFENDVALLIRSRPQGVPVTAVFVDLDGFKAINDNLGHDTGDQVLIRFAELMTRTFRASDIIIRKGGDEFAVILIDAAGDTATVSAERLLEVVRNDLGLQLNKGGVTYAIGASIGIASGLVGGKRIRTAFDELMRRADKAMYAAKHGGKGRVEHHGDDPEHLTDFGDNLDS